MAGLAALRGTHDFSTLGTALGLFGQLGFGTRTKDHWGIPELDFTETPGNPELYREICVRTIGVFQRETPETKTACGFPTGCFSQFPVRPLAAAAMATGVSQDRWVRSADLRIPKSRK